MSTTSASTVGADDAVDARFDTFFRTKDVVLRNLLVESHLGLAEFHCRRFSSPGVSRDDVRQVARLAIIGAVDRFDPGRGVAFATFASRTIEGECQRYLRDRTWGVRPPRGMQETYLATRRAQAELTPELGRAPTVTELAARVGRSEEAVIDALEAGNARSFRTIESAGNRADEGPTHRTPLDTRSAEIDREGTAYEVIELRLTLAGVVDRLSARDREIVELRFTGGWTERDIAAHLGISQSYLSRCLRRILRDLRRLLDEGEGD